ncbi:hypothetical protein ACFUNF_14755 [Streptomyces sp. NPDC057291]|uniref:hypothetical protein n=1 Tax=Streptomyces sp. NPDC057291 TaxID=3346087 RepID=UPI00362A9470
MTERPSKHWRRGVAEEARKLAAGTITVEDAFMAALYPVSLLDATDEALDAFESALGTLRRPSDNEVFAAVQRVVLDLNAINDQHDGAGYETGEREELCQYIDQALSDRGIDVPALTARCGLGRYEITDKWRDW